MVRVVEKIVIFRSDITSEITMSAQSQMMQWMSLTEEVIFLLDGSLHLSDLLRPPEHNPYSNYFDCQIQQLVSASEGLDAAALSVKIEEICRHGHDNLCQMQTDYQLQALTGLWAAREQCLRAQRERSAKELNRTAAAAMRARDTDAVADADKVKSKLSMMLLFPLLQSQSKTDPALRSVTTRLLTEFLRERAASPMSIDDSDESLVGLEDMLIEWIRGEGTDAVQLREAATALVSLACAQQSLLTVVKTIKVLEAVKDKVEELDVGDIMGPFEALEGGKREPQLIIGSHHVRSWKCASDLRVGQDVADTTGEAEMGKTSLAACNGKYLFTTNEEGYGIAKVGTGYFLTIR